MLFLFVAYISMLLSSVWISANDSFAVNKIIGDFSFKEKYSVLPVQTSPEMLRIQTHLEYVEGLLRRQTEMKNNNSKKLESLNHLNNYWENGEFPQHNASFGSNGDRRPRFIDHRNVYCAVGYLILKSPGFEQLPNEINLQNEYSYVDQIKNENLQKWMNLYGYTLDELSLIQPTYGGPWFKPKHNRTFGFIKPIHRSRDRHTRFGKHKQPSQI